MLSVTPFVGVWIEIVSSSISCVVAKRHSLRGSVDWNFPAGDVSASPCCHSLRGSVDWNRIFQHLLRCRKTSLPSWECGLKYFNCSFLLYCSKSLPSWECGLKSFFIVFVIMALPSLPSWECGLKLNTDLRSLLWRMQSLPSWECGLKFRRDGYWDIRIGHSLRGSVDWNKYRNIYKRPFKRHSLRGSVDWNRFDSIVISALVKSLPSWECGLKLWCLIPL